MRVLVLVATLMAALLAGCGGKGPGGTEVDDGPAAGIRFVGAFDVDTIPDEAGEVRGPLQVQWEDGLVAIASTSEPDLAHRTLVDGDDAYVSRTGMGWIRYDLAEGLRNNDLSNRVLLWDLPAIAAYDGLASERSTQADGDLLHLSGTVQRAGRSFDADLRLLVDGDRVLEARLDSPQGRESPYSFTPANESIPWAAVPKLSLPEGEVVEGDGKARNAHVQVIQLLMAYRTNHAGLVPETVDPETLAVEMIQSGATWPSGTYDGEPLTASERSGHFSWVRCGLQDGVYTGYGWDGLIVSEQYGPQGCPKKAAKA